MTGKDKFIYILLCIITLGIYPLTIKKKANYEVNTKLSEEKKVTVNISKLLIALGGEENIAGSEYTHTKVKIFFNDKSKVSIDGLDSIKNISGVVASSKSVTILVGKQAKALSESL